MIKKKVYEPQKKKKISGSEWMPCARCAVTLLVLCVPFRFALCVCSTLSSTHKGDVGKKL